MTSRLPRFLRTAILLLALGLPAVAAPAALAASTQPAHAAATQHLVIQITSTGTTVWGTVTVRYTSGGRSVQRSTSRPLTIIAVPRGVTVHLKQQPLDAITWPFEEWTIVRGGQTLDRPAAATAIKVTGTVQVTAVYFFN